MAPIFFRLPLFLLLLGFGMLQTSKAEGTFRIASFHTEIQAQLNGSLKVTEIYHLQAREAFSPQDFFRPFPVFYPRSDGKDMSLGMTIQSVLLDGAPTAFRLTPKGK